MDSAEIKTALSALITKMLAKAIVKPDAMLIWGANVDPIVALREGRISSYETTSLFHSKGKSLAEHFQSCDAFVDSLPSPEEKRMKNFMKAVATAIEVVRASDIEVDFLNPLQAMMKKLSENAITDQRTDKSDFQGEVPALMSAVKGATSHG